MVGAIDRQRGTIVIPYDPPTLFTKTWIGVSSVIVAGALGVAQTTERKRS
jgi:hypothetical protein